MPYSSSNDDPCERVPAPFDPELSRLANTLAVLEPRSRPFDRDALMFRAGQASAPRTGWVWPLAVTVPSLLAVVFGAALVFRSSASIAPEVRSAPAPRILRAPEQDRGLPVFPIEDDTPSSTNSADELPISPHYQLHHQVLRWGLDGLPPAPRAAPAPPSESIDMLLRSF